MKIKDIQVEGFGVWSGLSVDSVPESMTLIYGPNEAGKTTLMQFLRAMFYGFTPERRGRYLPPVHGGVPGGAIRVTGPGGGYEIRRHAQLTDSSVVGQLTVTGHDGLTQGQHRLSSLLGQIDEPIFTNVFAIGIRELQELSTLDDTSAADELYKLSSGLDRVSLVDVMRSLRVSRGKLIGKDRDEQDETAVLAALVSRKEKLRDEAEQLTRLGRRWSELASQRRSQDREIEELLQRVARWQTEQRCVEVAAAVHDSWRQRESLAKEIASDEVRTQLPDDAPAQLIQIEALMEERARKLEEIKSKRRELRQRAEELPLDKRLLGMQRKIEAAGEQATWVEALEEQIVRLEQQTEKAKQQWDAEAEKFGLSFPDDQGNSSRRELPDLSKQTLATLAPAAKEIKTQLFVMKQARDETRQQQGQADKIAEKLTGTIKVGSANNLHDAMRRQAEGVANLRGRIQLENHLDKLRKHLRDLEKEALDLATDEAFPLEQRVLLFVPFLFGGIGVIYGMVHVLGWTWFNDEPDPTWGMTMVFMGLLCFFLWYTVRERGYTGTSLELEDCERRIDAVKKQIREFEAERDQLDTRIPAGSGPLETRLREAESMQQEIESALPIFHTHQAAMQASKAARDRASRAAEALKTARRAWTVQLQKLGLGESLSPGSIRELSDHYEQLQANRRRLLDLEAERDLRKRERATIAKRIEMLYFEAMGDEPRDESTRQEPARGHDQRGHDQRGNAQSHHSGKGNSPGKGTPHPAADPNASRGAARRRVEPLDQLRALQESLASQQQWIKRRGELRDQDLQLKKAQASCTRTIERCEQQRRSLWAKCGVATAEQFYELVDVRTRLTELRSQAADLDKQIRGIIGAHIEYQDVARELQGASAADLQRRYDSLQQRIGETETRLAVLRTSQGELSQEMKQLGEDDRLATLQLELGCVEQQIESIVRRWQTFGMASSLLEDVCRTFERERQPETLREASSFLSQLTDGKYVRVWTPLGTSQLKVDGSDGQSLDLEFLSRGTREAVFIALRLSLAAAYARRGVMVPLILDDVLVNFDRDRALAAARTLKTFSELGHQVLMFTCHRHIAETFQEIDVQVRQLPRQGAPGRATVLGRLVEPKPAPVVAQVPVVKPKPLPIVEVAVEPPVEAEPEPLPAPVLQVVAAPVEPPADIESQLEREVEELRETIGWNWYEEDPVELWSDDAEPEKPQGVEGVWDRNVSWVDPAETH